MNKHEIKRHEHPTTTDNYGARLGGGGARLGGGGARPEWSYKESLLKHSQYYFQ